MTYARQPPRKTGGRDDGILALDWRAVSDPRNRWSILWKKWQCSHASARFNLSSSPLAYTNVDVMLRCLSASLTIKTSPVR